MQRKEILIHGWDFAYDVEDWYPPLKASLKMWILNKLSGDQMVSHRIPLENW
jgi:hypothetical protein